MSGGYRTPAEAHAVFLRLQDYTHYTFRGWPKRRQAKLARLMGFSFRVMNAERVGMIERLIDLMREELPEYLDRLIGETLSWERKEEAKRVPWSGSKAVLRETRSLDQATHRALVLIVGAAVQGRVDRTERDGRNSTATLPFKSLDAHRHFRPEGLRRPDWQRDHFVMIEDPIRKGGLVLPLVAGGLNAFEAVTASEQEVLRALHQSLVGWRRLAAQYPDLSFADFHWTPNLVSSGFRSPRKRNVACSRLVMIDDPIWLPSDPEWPADIPAPNLIHETSPGNCQMGWLADASLTVEQYEFIQAWLANRLNADPHGLGITHLYRWPGTWSAKHDATTRAVEVNFVTHDLHGLSGLREVAPVQVATAPPPALRRPKRGQGWVSGRVQDMLSVASLDRDRSSAGVAVVGQAYRDGSDLDEVELLLHEDGCLPGAKLRIQSTEWAKKTLFQSWVSYVERTHRTSVSHRPNASSRYLRSLEAIALLGLPKKEEALLLAVVERAEPCVPFYEDELHDIFFFQVWFPQEDLVDLTGWSVPTVRKYLGKLQESGHMAILSPEIPHRASREWGVQIPLVHEGADSTPRPRHEYWLTGNEYADRHLRAIHARAFHRRHGPSSPAPSIYVPSTSTPNPSLYAWD